MAVKDIGLIEPLRKERAMRRSRIVVGLVLLAVLAAVVLPRAEAGPAVRTVALDAWPSAVAVDAHTGHAFIASSDVLHRTGRVSVLDAATGTIVGTVAVNAYPVAVAVYPSSPHGAD